MPTLRERFSRAWEAFGSRPAAAPRPAPEAESPGRPSKSGVPREYLSLHRYLDARFATTVVLTFAQIEDLLGFALPDVARRRPDWWDNEDDGRPSSAPSRSWTQARRTAQPNLMAQIVVFERAPA